MAASGPWHNLTYIPRIASGWDATSPRAVDAIGPRNAYHLVAIIDGTWTNQDGHRAGPGSVLFLDPDTLPLWQRSPGTREHCIVFTLVPKDEPQPNTELVWGVSVPPVLPPQVTSAIQPQLETLGALWWLDARRRLRAEALLALMICDLLDLLDACSSNASPDDAAAYADEPGIDPRVIRVEQLARARLKDWRTTDLAAAAGMDRSAFSRLYRRQRGISPGAFLDKARLSYAEVALSHPKPDLGGIARSIGFSSTSGFARWFRKHHACSPLSWHRRCRGERQ